MTERKKPRAKRVRAEGNGRRLATPQSRNAAISCFASFAGYFEIAARS